MENDVDILRSVAKGNQFAFAKLYDRFSEKVYNTAISYVKNVQDAEEVTQDVFTKIYRNAVKFKGDAKPSTWIYRIAVNTALTKLQNRKKATYLNFTQTENDQPDFEHPGVILEKKESSRALFQVIGRLADNQKTAFILSYIEGLPRQEVADVMEISLKAVESLLQRAKVNLRKELEKLYPNRRK